MDELYNFASKWNPRVLVPVVKIVHKKDCWVNLPANFAKQLHRSFGRSEHLPVIKVTCQEPTGFIFMKMDHETRNRAFLLMARAHWSTVFIHLVSRIAGQVYHFCWDGGSCANDYLEVPYDLAVAVGILSGLRVKLEPCYNVPVASKIQLKLERLDDFDILQVEYSVMEQSILNQVGAVFAGQSFPLYLRNQSPFIVAPVEILPGPIGRLTFATELEVIPAEPGSELIEAKESSSENQISDPRPKPSPTVKEGNVCSHWLRLAKGNLFEDMGVLEMPETKVEKPFNSNNDTDENAVAKSMLSTCCAVHSITAKRMEAREGCPVIIEPEPPSDDDPCDRVKEICLRVLVNDSVALGHILVPRVVREALKAELFEYVLVKVVDILSTKYQDVKFLLHPVSFRKDAAAPEDTTGRELRISNRKIDYSKTSQQEFSGGLQVVLKELMIAWVSYQVASASSRALKEWDTLLLQSGSVVHMVVDVGSGSPREFTYLLEVCHSNHNNELHQGPAFVSWAEIVKQLAADRIAVALSSTLCIDALTNDFFPLDLAMLSDPPWLTETVAGTMSHVIHWLDPVFNLGSSPKPGLCRNVLVSGAKGTGKTSFVSGIARMMQEDSQIQAMVSYMQLRSILENTKPGAAVKNMKEAILEHVHMCMRRAPSIMIFDDIESIAPANEGDSSNEEESDTGSWLLELIDHVNSSGCPVMFLLTCESPNEIEEVLRNEPTFYTVEIPNLSPASRTDILSNCLEERGARLAGMPMQDISDWGTGYEAGDLVTLADRTIRQHFLDDIVGGPHSAEKKHMPVGHLDVEKARKGFQPAAFSAGRKGDDDTKGWEDVGGLHEVKTVIHEAVELPLVYGSLVSMCPLRLRTGVLLFGPPGCGKTYVVSAAVAALKVRLVSVKGPELLNKYIGASEAAVRDVFQKAASCAPCVLFFDEFEALAPKRGQDSTGVSDRVVNQLLTEMDGIEALQGVSVIAASSRPDLIDPALLRPGRLDRWVHCPLPDGADRLEILVALSRKLVFAEEVSLEALAKKTEGFTGADLSAVLSEAHLSAVLSRVHGGDSGSKSSDLVITLADVDKGLSSVNPSISSDRGADLDKLFGPFVNSGSQLNSDKKEPLSGVGKRVSYA